MEPLDPELCRIIREGLAEAAPGPGVEGRVLAGLLARLPDGGGDGGAGGGEVVGGASGANTAGAAGVKAWWIAGVVALGVVTATVATRETEPVGRVSEKAAGASGHVSKDMPVVEEATAPPVQSGVVADAEARVVPAVKARGVARTASSGASAGETRGAVEADTLLAETRGVAEAEAALGRGEFVVAIERVQELARSHPAGQLRIEREAVEICARCGLREAGAGALAEAFLRAYADAAVAGKVRARCAEALEEKF